MSADAGRIWRKVLDQLKQDMSAANFESYFSGTEAEVFADDEMVVSIDNPLTRDTLVARFRQHILRALFDVVGRECRLRLVTDGNGTGSPGPRERADGLVLLSDVRPRAMRYLWKGRIPLRTVTIIGGAPGDGKTTLTDDLAARWTSGREMPDGSRSDLPGGCGVVLLKYEDALAETTRPRLEAFGAALALIVTFDEGEGGAPLPTLGDVERLERAVRTRLDVPIGALIVDPIMAAMPPGLDAYRDQDVRPMLIELIRLAERTNIAVVLVAHPPKYGTGRVVHHVAAAIGFTALPRSVLVVGTDPDDVGRRIVAVSKRNLRTKAPPSLACRLEGEGDAEHLVWEGETKHLAEDLFAEPPSADDRSAIEDAAEWLQVALRDGERWAIDIQRDARRQAISRRTLSRAREQLQIATRREGFGPGSKVMWSLPRQDTQPGPPAPAIHDHPAILDHPPGVVKYGEAGRVWTPSAPHRNGATLAEATR